MEHVLAYKPMENQELYGTYIYGNMNDDAMITHYRAGRERDIKIQK